MFILGSVFVTRETLGLGACWFSSVLAWSQSDVVKMNLLALLTLLRWFFSLCSKRAIQTHPQVWDFHSGICLCIVLVGLLVRGTGVKNDQFFHLDDILLL